MSVVLKSLGNVNFPIYIYSHIKCIKSLNQLRFSVQYFKRNVCSAVQRVSKLWAFFDHNTLTFYKIKILHVLKPIFYRLIVFITLLFLLFFDISISPSYIVFGCFRSGFKYSLCTSNPWTPLNTTQIISFIIYHASRDVFVLLTIRVLIVQRILLFIVLREKSEMERQMMKLRADLEASNGELSERTLQLSQLRKREYLYLFDLHMSIPINAVFSGSRYSNFGPVFQSRKKCTRSTTSWKINTNSRRTRWKRRWNERLRYVMTNDN